MRGFQVGQEFGEIACVFGESCEAADAVPLSRPAAAAFHCDAAQFAAHGGDGSRAFGKRAEIDFERSRSIQAAQGAYAIASARQQYRKLGAANLPACLQFGGRLEFYPDA